MTTLWLVGGGLVAIFVALLVMAHREDRARRDRQARRMSTWVRPTANPTDVSYDEWLNAQDWQTIGYVDALLSGTVAEWPSEPQVGYDERRESA